MIKNIVGRWFAKEINNQVRARLAVVENDNSFLVGTRSTGSDRDRVSYNREEILEESLEAWRVNPLARRIIELTTQYVVGGGLRFSVDHAATHKFVDTFWNHALNQLPMRAVEWCDELSRAGEIFLLVTTGPDGMSYARIVPALNVKEIITAANDVQQELEYLVVSSDGLDESRYPGALARLGRSVDGGYLPFMLHYAVNRPAGAVRGESDLAPLLRWLSRYSGWLEDRARLNRYRNTFLWQVKARFATEAERLARQAALTLTPPAPGSILVTDESETWGVMSPKLESADAGEDGLSLKKMIAAGAGLPLHFLAEPEGSTRTTAESAGGPTYRRFEQRQEFFVWLVGDLLRVVIERRRLVDSSVKADARVVVRGADLSARDNAALAVAASTVVSAFQSFRDRGLIDDLELMRLAYRFLGEVVDLEALLAAGKKASFVLDKNPAAAAGGGAAGGVDRVGRGAAAGAVKVDQDTGDVTAGKGAPVDLNTGDTKGGA
jgi:hypothetical protein